MYVCRPTYVYAYAYEHVGLCIYPHVIYRWDYYSINQVADDSGTRLDSFADLGPLCLFIYRHLDVVITVTASYSIRSSFDRPGRLILIRSVNQ